LQACFAKPHFKNLPFAVSVWTGNQRGEKKTGQTHLIYAGKISRKGRQAAKMLKSITALAPVHRKQVLTYLRLSQIKLGLLINFGGQMLKGNIERLVNNLEESSSAE
jgi:hypothetical protein